MDLATSLSSGSNSIEYLVQQYMQFEMRPKEALLQRQTDLNTRKTALTDLDSKLSTLQNVCERFTDPITDYFAAKTGASSDSDLLGISTTSSAQLGSHSIEVLQLAVSDTRVSKQYNDTDTSFGSFVTDQTFTVELAHPTDLDSDNRVSISVTVAAAVFSQSDENVLADVADAINNAISQAVLDETIENNEDAQVSVAKEEDGTSRLVMRAESSGYTFRLDFTDSADNLLQALELNTAVQTTGTSGGYVTAVGTGDTDSALNSKFKVDGLTYYRDSNSVSDALTGVTLKFNNIFATAETVTVTANTETVTEEVDKFLTAYNESLDYLKTNTQMNPVDYSRGILADDVAFRGIIYDLRNYSITNVVDVNNSDFSILYDIGIEADSNGKLSISDKAKFTAALETNSNYVAEIFNASDGIATKMQAYIENYVKTSGTISNSKKNIDSQLIALNDQLTRVNDMLTRKEALLREQFTAMQDMMYQLQSQQAFLSSFSIGG